MPDGPVIPSPKSENTSRWTNNLVNLVAVLGGLAAIYFGYLNLALVIAKNQEDLIASQRSLGRRNPLV